MSPWSFLKNPFRAFKDTRTNGEVGIEKRRMQRIDTVIAIDCQNAKKGSRLFEIITCNVNVLGVMFFSPLKLSIGDVLEMKISLFFHLPRIIARGRVVWCRKKALFGHFRYEGGIEFITMTEKDKKTFQKFINKHWMN
jgi:hypothetical protein